MSSLVLQSDEKASESDSLAKLDNIAVQSTRKRNLIADLSQRAMDIGMDGLIIESHPTPDEAWSDAAQQVTPEVLGEILA